MSFANNGPIKTTSGLATAIRSRGLAPLFGICVSCLSLALVVPTIAQQPPDDPAPKRAPMVKGAQTASGDTKRPTAPSTAAAAKSEPQLLPWLSALKEGRLAAQKATQPMLVRVGGESCPWCKKLDAEMAQFGLQRELSRWTRVYLDADKAYDDVRELGVGPIPALRVMTSRGRLVASYDGYLPAAKLLSWLDEAYAKATDIPDDILSAQDQPAPSDVPRLVAQFAQREPALREAALRRLLPYPRVAAPPVVKSLREGNLSVKLAALELLRDWKAPISGLDPWQAESMTDQRLAALERWAATAAGNVPRPSQLTAEELARARQEIVAMLRASDAEAEAVRERLARFGAALLPEVQSRLKQTDGDQARERLTALRYRLVSSDALVLQWPGGVPRLAAVNTAERRKAADELTHRARPADEALLLELFADSDALVREIALRGLKSVAGTRASSALLKLLDDPEPNVRAAVLKALAENMPPGLTARIAAYAVKETDADLVIHALRALRENHDTSVADSLIQLLKHSSWQVRAGAAENLGKLARGERGRDDTPTKDAKAMYAALTAALNDTDSFVVGKAIEALDRYDDPSLVEPLTRVVATHPEVAGQAVRMLAGGGPKRRAQAVTGLRKFLTHADPTIRAAVIAGLCEMEPDGIDRDVAAALADATSEVRIAAAAGMLSIMDRLRPNERGLAGDDEEEAKSAGESPTLPSRILDLFRGGKKKVPEKAVEEGEPPPPGSPPTDEPPPKRQPAEPSSSKDAAKRDSAKRDGAKSDATKAVKIRKSPKPADDPLDLLPSVDLQLEREQAAAKGAVAKRPVAKRPVAKEPVAKEPVAKEPLVKETVEPDSPEQPLEAPPPRRKEDRQQAAAESVASAWDQWIVDFRAGTAKRHPRPSWMARMGGPLRKMLEAPTPEERAAAAVALVPLGAQETALPVLLSAVQAKPALVARAKDALHWLPWAERLRFFDQLLALQPLPDAVAQTVAVFASVSDPRAAPRLWQLLDDARVTPQFADTLRDSLKQVYWGGNLHRSYYNGIETRDADRTRRDAQVLKEAAPLVAQAPRWKKIVALTLVAQASSDEAARLAAGAWADKQADPQTRRDALQFLLLNADTAAARRAAVTAIPADDPQARRLALLFLADGGQWLRNLAEGYYLEFSTERDFAETGAIPNKPTDLDANVIRPLLKDGDAEVVALATYLLAMLEEPVDLGPLVSYWAAHRQHALWPKLLVRALALADKTDELPTLKEIYADWPRRDVREFYWTIRIMSRPELAKFRQQIRAEVGSEALQ